MNIETKFSRKPIAFTEAMDFLNERVEQLKNGRNKELIWVLEHPLT